MYIILIYCIIGCSNNNDNIVNSYNTSLLGTWITIYAFDPDFSITMTYSSDSSCTRCRINNFNSEENCKDGTFSIKNDTITLASSYWFPTSYVFVVKHDTLSMTHPQGGTELWYRIDDI